MATALPTPAHKHPPVRWIALSDTEEEALEEGVLDAEAAAEAAAAGAGETAADAADAASRSRSLGGVTDFSVATDLSTDGATFNRAGAMIPPTPGRNPQLQL